MNKRDDFARKNIMLRRVKGCIFRGGMNVKDVTLDHTDSYRHNRNNIFSIFPDDKWVILRLRLPRNH